MELAQRTNMMSPSCSWLRNASPCSTSVGVARGQTLRSTAALGSKSLSWLHGPRNRTRARAMAAAAELSLAEPSGFQVTAQGWLASYDSRLSQDFWSRQSAPGGAGGGSADSPERLPPIASDTAKRENFKKEHYSDELDRIALLKEKTVGQPPKRAKDFLLKRSKTLAELTAEVSTAANIRDEIDQLMQGAHDQHKHFKPQKVEFAELTRQEERERAPVRKHEPPVRRAKNTDQPRNPKWRVEERIKRERERWKDSGEPPMCIENLPMTQFAVQGEHGKAQYSLVDVKGIQSQCVGLSANCSAKSLLEQRRLLEEAPPAKKQSDYSSCRPQLDALAKLSWEDRMDLAERRKLQGYVSNVFDKMGAMRSKYPKQVPDSIVNHLHSMAVGDFAWHEEGYPQG